MKHDRVSTGKKQAKIRVVEDQVKVRVPMGEVVLDAYQDFLDLSIKTGMQVMLRMMQEDVDKICGPRYRHQEKRKVSRWGETDGEVALGGRRIKIRRPRARKVNGGSEERLPTYEEFNSDVPVRNRVMEQILSGVSGRGYEGSLEVDVEGRATSRSAVSRRFVAMTQARMVEWLNRPMGDVNLLALMLDGIEMGEDHTVIVALGVDTKGNKHVLGAADGSTENAELCKEFLSDMMNDRGLRIDGSVLVVIDGGKGIRKAIRQVFSGEILVQRCQEHKIRNVVGKVAKSKRSWVGLKMRGAYKTNDFKKARRMLMDLARELEHDHPGAANSLREGLDETLTVLRLNLPPILRRTLGSTNPIESMNSIIRTVSRNVKRWRNGNMALRWTVTGVIAAEKKFHRIRGYRSLPILAAALENRIGLDVQKEVA